MKQIIVGENDSGRRLDAFLMKLLDIPSPLLYKYLRLKRVRVNGKPGAMSARLKHGDILEIYLSDHQFRIKDYSGVTASDIGINLSVIYEDQNILIADKPAGLLAHPDESRQTNTLISQIKAYLYKKGEYSPENENVFSPALCNRIDRNTAGLVIAAKNAESLRILNERLRLGEIRRFYLCLVKGIPEKKTGVLENYVYKDRQKNRVFITDNAAKKAKLARTGYTVLAYKEGISLVEAELLTGRTHQIRAQFSHAGHPLAGDGKYDENTKGPKSFSQALYSYKIVMDFRTPAGRLDYLNNKTFKALNVPFAEKFMPNYL